MSAEIYKLKQTPQETCIECGDVFEPPSEIQELCFDCFVDRALDRLSECLREQEVRDG